MYFLLLFFFSYNNFIISINTILGNIPKEIIHGKPENDSWKAGYYYEYYIDISNYDIDEENVLEIYGINDNINTDYINLYLLLTNITDAELIKNNTITPDIEKDKYNKTSVNIQRDELSRVYYFFLIFKKTAASQHYLIIKIQCIYSFKSKFYVGHRIPSIKVEKTVPDKIEIFNQQVQIRDDIRLYYKLDINNIDKINNNIYIFLADNNIKEKHFGVHFFTDFSIVEPYKNDLLILEKNKTNITEVYFGIKSINISKSIDLIIRIDNKDFYLIENDIRKDIKLYIENIKCDKDIFIIENYKNFNVYKTFLILEKLYGNYSLKYYDSINNLNFENLNEKTGIETTDKIIEVASLNSIYILKCKIPSAFNFEIFYDLDLPRTLEAGGSKKTLLHPNFGDDRATCVNLLIGKLHSYNYEECKNEKYKAHVSILNFNNTENNTFETFFHSQGKDYPVFIKSNHTELIYCDNFDRYYPNLAFWVENYTFIEYYYSSNNLYQNIAEGRTNIDIYQTNLAYKIKKDNSFDYILLEAQSKENIIGYYEIKLINDEDLEGSSNNVMVEFPKVKMPEDKNINLNFSNPYNKFESILDENDVFNNFYLLLNFKITKSSINVNINIDLVKSEQIEFLSEAKPKIILPETEYEIKSSKLNYNIKNKIIYNINKCDNTSNYTFISYYQDKNNLIKKSPILNSHEIIILDNLYYQSKMQLHKESNAVEEQDIIYPAVYYNKGDILLNYFFINSNNLNNLKFNSDLSINYEEKDWSNIGLSWKEYVFKEEKNKRTNIPTNYSIYILPKYSIVNTMCQLSLIPANISVKSKTNVDINLNEGEYKITIVANVIDEEIPFNIKYNTIELNIIKKYNVTLIVLLSVLGVILALIVPFLIFRKKIILRFKRKRSSTEIDDSIYDNKDSEINDEEEQNKAQKQKLTEELIKMINKN